ncbi:MAG: radical SAM protein [Desulfobacteraceae bacterium]|nr:radical SAM protein [Desulfobacteraceae bacterium]
MNSTNSTNSTNTHVFGPVPSRRLGLSLGVDLIPAKTCTFDCLYCEVGRTTNRTLQRRPYVPVSEVLAQIRQKLLVCKPDIITLAGSGEPTLHSEIDQVIYGIKEITDARVAVLTNGSLFWDEEIRRRVQGADIIMPTLSSAFDRTFKRIHRPHPELDLGTIVGGLKSLRREYHGQLLLEVVFLSGINDTEEEEEALKDLIDTICPDRIQINTVVRPPSDSRAKSLDRERLEEIKLLFGKNAEVIAGTPFGNKEGLSGQSSARSLLDTVKRRPLRAIDIVNSLSLDPDEVDDLIKGLLIKGYIRRQEHSGEIFYLSNEEDD